MVANPTQSLGWSFSEKAVRLFLGTALTLLIARQMGPAEFGTFSTVFAVFMLFTAVAGLGLKDIVVDEIASGRGEARAVISSAAGLMFVAGAGLAIILAGSSALICQPLGSQFWVALILSIVLVVKGFDALLFGLEAHAKLRTAAVAQQISILASAAAKGVLLVAGASAVSFAGATTLELVVLYAAVAALAVRQGIYLSPVEFRKDCAIQLLRRSWPLMASSLAVIGYFYIDQIIIAILMDPEAVGIYATASRISQQLYVLPTILVAAYYPRLTSINSYSDGDFTDGFTALAVVLVAVSIAVCVLVFLFGDGLLSLLLGDRFAATGEIFKFHVVGLIFVSLNVVSGRWYVMQGLQHLALIRQLLTATLNVLLNFLLIPFFGLTGAVLATLISLLFLAFFFDYFSERTRSLAKMKRKFFMMLLSPSTVLRAFQVLRTI